MEELEVKLNNELSNCKKNVNTGKIICGVCALLFLIFLINFAYIKNFIFITVAGIILSFSFVIYYKNKFLKELKPKIFQYILTNIFTEKKAIYVPNGISEDKFIESGLSRNFNSYYTSDGIKNIDDFYFANATAINKTKESQSTTFIGVFGVAKTNEFYNDEIIIAPDYENKYTSNLASSTKKLLGEDRNTVRLENAEFEKYFEVYSKNQLKARELVTVEYMEKLMYLRNKLNVLIKIRYVGNKKYIAIWNKRILDEKKLYKYGVNLENITQNIKDILEVIEKV